MKNNLLFEMYKDIGLSSEKFKELAYKIGVKDYTDTYVKIINYQIEKYGKQLSEDDYIEQEMYRYQLIKEYNRRKSQKNYYRHRRCKVWDIEQK